MLNQEKSYPVSVSCDLFSLSPSTYYYRPVLADEGGLEAAIVTQEIQRDLSSILRTLPVLTCCQAKDRKVLM